MTLSSSFRNVVRLGAWAGLLAILAAALLGGASSAQAAGSWGVLEHFGGAGKNKKGKRFELNATHAFGVDPKDNSVYVVDGVETEESSGEIEFRIQKYSEIGNFLAKRVINPAAPVTEDSVEGVAVDSAKGRIYVLEVAPSTAKVSAETSVAATLYAFSTEPTSGELKPASGTKEGGVLATPEELSANSEELGKALLSPSGIAVDPVNHDIVLLGEANEGSAHGGNHLALDLIGEQGGLQRRYVDPKSTLAEKLSPSSPVVSNSGNVYFTAEGSILEIPSTLSMAPEVLFEPHANGHAFEEALLKPTEPALSGFGGAELAIAPEGSAGTLYTSGEIDEVEKEGEKEGEIGNAGTGLGVIGVSYAEPAGEKPALSDFGWTGGGIGPGEEGKCNIGFAGELVSVGNTHRVFVLSPEDDEVLEFGESGSSCPTATPRALEAKINGVVQKEAVEAKQEVTLSANIIDTNVVGTEWQFGDGTSEKATAPSGFELQRAETGHKFKKDGKLEVVAKIHTDDLASSNFEVKGTVTVIGPAITKEPLGQTVGEGGTAKFEASAAGEPTPTVQWEVRPSPEAEYEALAGQTSDTLTITGVTPADSGHEYRAKFKNACSKGSCTASTEPATLTVTHEVKKPKVTKNPENKTVTEGETATFLAEAEGAPTPQVQWEVSTDGGKTWTLFTGATSDELKIENTTQAESGHEYRAMFKNELGEATSTPGVLTVEKKVAKAPKVTKNPENVAVAAGETAVFLAEAEGSPKPQTQWEVSTDGGKTWIVFAGQTSDELKIESTTGSESGDEYRAVFTNELGKATSKPATLTVESKKPTVTQNPESKTVTEGETAVFLAKAEGSPAPQLQWEVSIDGGKTWTAIAGETKEELKIESTKLSESGHEYRAVFKNEVGEAISAAATLTVEREVTKAPEITKPPESTTVIEGETATFSAVASGKPMPTVQWQVSTDGGTTWTNVSGETSDRLRIKFTNTSESGYEYRAVFANVAGEVKSNAATLTVVKNLNEQPTIREQPPENVTVTEGETATFKAVASGTPTPSVRWWERPAGTENWTEMHSETATSDELKIPSSTLSESGNLYQAVFTSGFGPSAESDVVRLTVNRKGTSAATSGAQQAVLHAQEANVRPTATLASTSVTVGAKGTIVLEVTCPAGETICSGTVTLRTLTAVSATSTGKKKGKARRHVLTIASGAFVVAGGGVRTITLRLSPAGRTLLNHSRLLRARAIVSARDPAGARSTTQLVVTLRSVKSKRRH